MKAWERQNLIEQLAELLPVHMRSVYYPKIVEVVKRFMPDEQPPLADGMTNRGHLFEQRNKKGLTDGR